MPEIDDSLLDTFHPAVAAWFSRRFAGGPTAPQRAAWPLIRRGDDVLVAAPTGTGKTLTGFLVAIDAAYRAAEAGQESAAGVSILYLSPLRALATDIAENLERPLAEIAEIAAGMGVPPAVIATAVRTGDTSPSERAAMRRRPPQILCTTPESLYVLLTSVSGRAMLSGVRTVIVDEIHAMARDKRGSHLSLSVERLDALVSESGGALQRIGLSATQRPLEVVANLLGGSHPDRPMPTIVDCVRDRVLDVAIELPDDELDSVASHRQMDQVLAAIAAHVMEHRTTLVFVNTRRLAERVAHLLAERLGGPDYGLDDAALLVASHHGSLSAPRRRQVEDRLRAGDLKALVATASLELGIDVGPVEMVCQIGSPRAIATFLQRVGRANHAVGGVPTGRLYPMTRDEMVECTALLAAVAEGDLDQLEPPVAPIDIAIQQMVAEVAAREEMAIDDLRHLVRSASPFASLSDETFDEALELASRGIMTGRGRRGGQLHLDGVNGRVRARQGARFVALTSGGAIPETGDYRVILDPEGITVGAVHEDFAIDSSAGDVFLLGTHAWRITKVELGVVRVVDAAGAAPTIPFWLGEAPARTRELSEAVGALRGDIEKALDLGGLPAAEAHLLAIPGVVSEVAIQVAAYLAAARSALGALPTRDRIIIERFFDDVDSTQLVIHSPFGGRINRALGLALRKRFCVTFDFELQAAADDDTVTIALGPHHSFPLSQVASMVTPATLEEVLIQAVLLHPMLAARWRWNLSRALIIPRTMGGKRRPIHLQRMEADDLLAAAWPSLAACQENAAAGPIPVPDHILVRQTLADVLFEPLDVVGATEVLERIASGSLEVVTVESAEPSPLALGILNGRPYTFLDDAPLEERRSRAVPQTRGLGPIGIAGLIGDATALAPLDPSSVARVLESVAPRPRNPDELHDFLFDAVVIRPVESWGAMADALAAAGRLRVIDGYWVTTERAEDYSAMDLDDDVAADCLRAHLERSGPVDIDTLVRPGELACGTLLGAPLRRLRAETAIRRLEGMGLAIELPDGRWCARHLLARLHGASRSTRRRGIEAVPITTYLMFLAEYQHVAPATRLEGRAGLLSVLEQLSGIELPIGDWESSVLPARLIRYDPRWLDELCLAGEVAWGRLTPKFKDAEAAAGSTRATPSRATPIAFMLREDLRIWLDSVRLGEDPPSASLGIGAEIAEILGHRGACFRSEFPSLLGRLPVEVDEGLFDLLSRGLVTADGFGAVRALLSPTQRFARRQRPVQRPHRLAPRRSPAGSGAGEGRWSLLDPTQGGELDKLAREELAEEVAVQMLRRWGVVFFEISQRESFRLPWREITWALRRLEARGEVLGGRFVAGLSGEQFATPEVVRALSRSRVSEPSAPVTLAASDPLNLSGTVVPGPRIPAVRRRSIVLGDGEIVAGSAS
ncbi:MAG: DEAD/DEAH box helicase [Actinomycetes bacterium]